MSALSILSIIIFLICLSLFIIIWIINFKEQNPVIGSFKMLPSYSTATIKNDINDLNDILITEYTNQLYPSNDSAVLAQSVEQRYHDKLTTLRTYINYFIEFIGTKHDKYIEDEEYEDYASFSQDDYIHFNQLVNKHTDDDIVVRLALYGTIPAFIEFSVVFYILEGLHVKIVDYISKGSYNAAFEVEIYRQSDKLDVYKESSGPFVLRLSINDSMAKRSVIQTIQDHDVDNNNFKPGIKKYPCLVKNESLLQDMEGNIFAKSLKSNLILDSLFSNDDPNVLSALSAQLVDDKRVFNHYSISKKLEDVFYAIPTEKGLLEKDYVSYLIDFMNLLHSNGCVYFDTKLTQFGLDEEGFKCFDKSFIEYLNKLNVMDKVVSSYRLDFTSWYKVLIDDYNKRKYDNELPPLIDNIITLHDIFYILEAFNTQCDEKGFKDYGQSVPNAKKDDELIRIFKTIPKYIEGEDEIMLKVRKFVNDVKQSFKKYVQEHGIKSECVNEIVRLL